jgi:orotidine-5'-phosphate decarboxylase
MTDHFADRLTAAVRARGNALCVGLDPRWESLPLSVCEHHASTSLAGVAAAYTEFCTRVIDVVAPLVPVVKPQSAFFEACGPDGLASLQRVLRHARERGVLTILDAKRGDIDSTAEAYAGAGLGGVTFGAQNHAVWDADAMTVNPYLGGDSLQPFFRSARRAGRGVFVLVRTSNPGAGQFQDLQCGGQPLFVHVARAVGVWSAENLGRCGFGDVGAVVGATGPAELRAVRQLLPNAVFLVPGFGAQGAAAADTAAAFREDGLGAVVNSSRGVIFACAPTDAGWEAKVEAAARSAVKALADATPMGRLRSV